MSWEILIGIVWLLIVSNTKNWVVCFLSFLILFLIQGL